MKSMSRYLLILSLKVSLNVYFMGLPETLQGTAMLLLHTRYLYMCSEIILAFETGKNMMLIKIRENLIPKTISFTFVHGLGLLS